MNYIANPFIDGIILAARHTGTQESQTLAADRSGIAELCLEGRPHGFLGNRQDAVEIPYDVAGAWLDYRREQPFEVFNPDQIRGTLKRRSSVIGSPNVTFDHIPDARFAHLFAGVLTGLEHFEKIETVVLEHDWRSAPDAYAKLSATYRTNGIPLEGIPVLAALEMLNLRTTNRTTLFSLGGIFNSQDLRYGYLEVKTIPSMASLTVDNEDWGESPIQNAIVAGTHPVEARKENLKGHDTATVVAAKQNHIAIELR